MSKPPIAATLVWSGDLRFSARTARTEILFDGTGVDAPTPPETIAMALGGCMGIDLVDIVTKGRYTISALEVSLVGRRVDTAPHRFQSFTLKFLVSGAVPDFVVERAIQLSRDRYCSVWHSLHQDIQLATAFEVRP